MKYLSILLTVAMVFETIMFSGPVFAQGKFEYDVRLYLKDGDIVTGKLIEHSEDLIILKAKKEIFTFEPEEVDKIVTLDSLGAGAKTVEVITFPRIGFLGATVGLGAVALLAFNSASEKDKDAENNRSSDDPKLIASAKELEDEATTRRLIGWIATSLAVGATGFAFYPEKEERRIFPDVSLMPGNMSVKVTYAVQF